MIGQNGRQDQTAAAQALKSVFIVAKKIEASDGIFKKWWLIQNCTDKLTRLLKLTKLDSAGRQCTHLIPSKKPARTGCMLLILFI